VLRDILVESLGNGDTRGAASPIEDVAFSNTVFLGESPVHLGQAIVGSRTSLSPEGVAIEVRLGHGVAFGCFFRFSASGMRVEIGFCSVKSKLLRQGIWLDNDDMRRNPLLHGLDCFGGLAIVRAGWRS
jgi:hypothetical protein